MMKNRAGLLALLVLVVATILMVFFVMPRINGDKKPIGDAINQAGDTVKNTIAENGQKAGDAAQKAGEATQGAVATATNAADVTKKLTDLSGMAVALSRRSQGALQRRQGADRRCLYRSQDEGDHCAAGDRRFCRSTGHGCHNDRPGQQGT